MKIVFLTFFLFLVSEVAFAQTTDNNLFSGVILKKEWTKTTQSYCAGGSDYYVLKTDTEEIVLSRGDEKANERYFKKWVGKKVSIKAEMVQKEIKNDNDMEQKPVTFNPDGKTEDTAFSCWILKVIHIRQKQ